MFLLTINYAHPILDEQQLHRVKVLNKFPDRQRNVLKLLTYQNLVNYRIIPIGFKLGKLKGRKGEVLSEEEEEKEGNRIAGIQSWITRILFFSSFTRNIPHFIFFFVLFSDMSKLAVGFKKPPTVTPQNKGKGILK